MSAGEITRLLRRMSSESGPARKETYDELVALVYDDLRVRARRQLRRERADSLRPTILVHEAYERLLRYRMPYADRAHFLNVAATAMRRYLIERARRVHALRRGGGQPDATLDATIVAGALRHRTWPADRHRSRAWRPYPRAGAADGAAVFCGLHARGGRRHHGGASRHGEKAVARREGASARRTGTRGWGWTLIDGLDATRCSSAR